MEYTFLHFVNNEIYIQLYFVNNGIYIDSHFLLFCYFVNIGIYIQAESIKRTNHRISENLQNCNQKIRNVQYWYNFYGKIVIQWFLRFQLNSVYLIIQNILRRKELDNLDNFSLKIRPELKITNFLITILIQSLKNSDFDRNNLYTHFCFSEPFIFFKVI